MIRRAFVAPAILCGLAAGQVLLAMPARADVIGQPCSEPSKISSNTADAYGEVIVCGGGRWGPMPQVQMVGSHDTGTPCNAEDGTTAIGGDAQVACLQMCYHGTWTHYRP
jgi:hypothetical protein